MKRNEYVLGLDIGITSVGWGIIDNNNGIISSGVRLFDEQSGNDKIQNLTRRGKRSGRRVKRRRTQRLIDLKAYLIRNELITKDFSYLENPYNIRTKGLYSKLSQDELATALLHIAKKRGSILDVSDESDEASKLKGTLNSNSGELRHSNLYVCELQLQRLNNTGTVRGMKNVFHTDDYVKEAKKLLKTQEIPNKFIEDIITIITRRRHFSEGPGSYTSPTPYGTYRFDENNNIIKVNLIDIMRGKCSVYPIEPRAPKYSFTAELFDFLNDLNNLKLPNKNKITHNQKMELVSIIRNEGYLKPKVNPVKGLLKYLRLKEDDVSGFRVSKSDKQLLSTFDGYQKVLKVFVLNGHKEMLTTELMDEISEVLTKTKLVDERKDELIKIIKVDLIVDALSVLGGFIRYHSLSNKAMKIINKVMLEKSENQMEVIQNLKLRKNNDNQQKTLEFSEEVAISPSAQRAQNQTLLVVRELQKEFGYFERIVIETTRARNSKEQKDRINKIQKKREQENIALKEELLGDNQDKKLKGKQILKLKLYKEQGGKCIYTGNTLNLGLIVNQKDNYEIDHILPYSISLDNSYNNKVLVERNANQIKGNNTPFHYFSTGMAYGNNKTFEQFKEFVISIYKGKRYAFKRDNLLYIEDISKHDNQRGFINRNLVDTSYAVKRVLNTLQNYYETNNIPTRVETIRGKVTSLYRNIGGSEYMRKYQFETVNPLEKDRNQYRHHAFDALIVARLSQQNLVRHMFDLSESETIDETTGEIAYTLPMRDSELKLFISNLGLIKDDAIRFSWKIDSKPNRRFSDETIYSTRIIDNEEKVVKKIKDIYALSSSDIKKKIIDKKEQLLVYKYNIQTYNILEMAYNQFKQEKYPYQEYMNQFGKLKKYSKKGNGPEITQLKYVDAKLGNHISITHKYNSKNKVVLLQLSTYRMDVYLDKDNVFKFVTLRYNNLRPEKKGYKVNVTLYDNLLKSKRISEEAEFKFSLFRNDIIRLKYKNPASENNGVFKFISVNNDNKNIIEYRHIAYRSLKKAQFTAGISTNLMIFEKFNVSPTGKYKKVEKEELKLLIKGDII